MKNERWEMWDLWKDAKRRVLLEKLANTSIQTCWWSHLLNAEEAAVGVMVMNSCTQEDKKVLAQWMDREGHLLSLPLLWLKPVNIVQPKAEAHMPRPAGREHVCRVLWGAERRGPHSSPCGEPAWVTTASRDKTLRGPQQDFVQDFVPRNPYSVLMLKQPPC